MSSKSMVAHLQLALVLLLLMLPAASSWRCNWQFTINVFTYNRASGLRRLWRSLLHADYMGKQVDMVLFHDSPKMNAYNSTQWVTRWIDNEATWPHGRFQVFKKVKNVGLVRSIVGAWYPINENSFAAFFEDDLEVSPYWFKWTYKALGAYYFVPNRHPKLIGLSLYRPIHDELTVKYFDPQTGNRPFVYQQPCSWGQVMFPGAWRYFRKWKGGQEARHIMPIVRLPVTSNSWDTQSSWKKYLIYLMHYKGLFMVYPNFPENRTLSTNHFMPGEHNLPDPGLYHLPLATRGDMQRWREAGVDVFETPPLEHLKVRNTMSSPVAAINRLFNANVSFTTQPFVDTGSKC